MTDKKDNAKANSGKIMYPNFFEIDFIINENEIDCNVTRMLIEKAKKGHKFGETWEDYYRSISDNKRISIYKNV